MKISSKYKIMASQLINVFTEYMNNGFFPYLCAAHGIAPEDVEECWRDYIKEAEGKEVVVKVEQKKPAAKKPSAPKAKPVASEIDDSDLSTLKLVELRELCRSKQLKVAGTKQQLVERLNDFADGKVAEKPHQSPKAKKTKKTSKTPQIPQVELDINENGNFIHAETGIVFSADEDAMKCREVVGWENEEGDVEELTSEKMEICKKYGFKFKIPENFD